MSFVAAVGSLIAGSGLEDILKLHLLECLNLSGKKFPENVRALRLIVEELLCPVLHKYDNADINNLTTYLETIRKTAEQQSSGLTV